MSQATILLRYLFVSMVLVTGLALTGSFLVVSGDDDSDDDDLPAIVGSWFCDIEGAGVENFELLATFTRDGSFSTSDTNDFSGLAPGLGNMLNPTTHGIWKMRGSTVRSTLYGFANAGVDSLDVGLPMQSVRVPCLSKVRGDRVAGSCDFDIFLASDPDMDGFPNTRNPFTSDPDISVPDAFSFECGRLGIVAK